MTHSTPLTDRAKQTRSFVDLDAWEAPDDEPIAEPDLPIIDSHHHLWDRPFGRYLFDDLLRDLESGHDVRSSVFIECNEMYRADGEEAFKPLGETEFVNGVAAMSASGYYGQRRACAAIVGHVDLTLGARAADVLDAQITVSGGRFRGIRHRLAYDASVDWRPRPEQHLSLKPEFREGFACLSPLNLTFEAWLYHTQMDDLLDLADAFPDTTIILNHVGGLIGVGAYEGRLVEMFPVWRDNISRIATRPNVMCKVGGMGMMANGFEFGLRDSQPGSVELAEAWRPYIEHCTEAFGAQRCMAESNFPPDRQTCSYRTMWNAYKRIFSGCSTDEKAAIFHGTASRVYRIPLPAK